MEKEKLYTTGDLAHLLNIPLYKLNYIIDTINLKEERRLAGKRIYTTKEAVIVQEYLEKRGKSQFQKGGNDKNLIIEDPCEIN